MRSSLWHAFGNTYLVVEHDELTPERARELARGADGVVQVLRTGEAEAEVVIWNPDGSTAELSGNGTRIAARWLGERTRSREVVIRVGAREVRARLLDGEIETDVGEVRVGAPEWIEGVRIIPVDVGNPHAVVEDDPARVQELGQLLETHSRFPNRTNVEVVRIDAAREVTARVWERGVGETTASGTGAVAAAAATHRAGSVTVHFPGGDLVVRLAGGRATLIGPAERL